MGTGSSENRQVVRANQFDRWSADFERVQATKMAHLLFVYTRDHVEPLERRIARLELVLGIRLLRWARTQAALVRLYLRSRFAPVEEEDAPEPAPEGPPDRKLILE